MQISYCLIITMTGSAMATATAATTVTGTERDMTGTGTGTGSWKNGGAITIAYKNAKTALMANAQI